MTDRIKHAALGAALTATYLGFAAFWTVCWLADRRKK